MSLISIEEVRDLVQTSLSDIRLQEIIDREEAVLIARKGAHYVDASTTVTEIVEPDEDVDNLYLSRAIGSVSSCMEKALIDTSWTTLTEGTDFYVWGNQGRLQRLYGSWSDVVQVVFVPVDDNAQRKAALLDLIRLSIERTAMEAENVAGEYSYSAPDWETERTHILARIGFHNV